MLQWRNDFRIVSAGAKIPIVPIEKSPPLTKFFSATDSRREEVRELLRGKDVNDIRELKRQGLSIQAISEMTGFDRKTIRRYLREPEGQPEYGPRPKPPSLLDAFKPYLEERLGAGVWNARVLLRELRDRNYTGGYTILTDWLRPQRQAAGAVAVRRFETPPGQQAQVDWGHLGSIVMDGREHKLWASPLHSATAAC